MLKWEIHVHHLSNETNVLTFWYENMNGQNQVLDYGVNGKIILKWILQQRFQFSCGC